MFQIFSNPHIKLRQHSTFCIINFQRFNFSKISSILSPFPSQMWRVSHPSTKCTSIASRDRRVSSKRSEVKGGDARKRRRRKEGRKEGKVGRRRRVTDVLDKIVNGVIDCVSVRLRRGRLSMATLRVRGETQSGLFFDGRRQTNDAGNTPDSSYISTYSLPKISSYRRRFRINSFLQLNAARFSKFSNRSKRDWTRFPVPFGIWKEGKEIGWSGF